MPMDFVTIYKRLWEYRVYELSEYIGRVESGIISDQRKLESVAKGWVDLDDELSDEYELAYNIVPRHIRYSQILLVYGIYEHSVCEVCELIGNIRSEFPPKPLYLHDAKKFLINAGVEEAIFGQAWEYIDGLRTVRNAIAHRNGVVAEDDTDITAFIEKDRAEEISRFLGSLISDEIAILAPKTRFC